MQDIFEQEMSRPTIFKDRNVLSPHYIPDHLPYRDGEITRIMKAIAPSLSQKRPNNIFVYGKTGTGKTSSTKHVLSRLGEAAQKYEAPVEQVYINCRIHNTKYQVLLKCAERLCPEESFMGHPATFLYERLLKEVAKKAVTFIVVLDEIDKTKDLDELMYSLTRSNDDLLQGHIALIGISNKIDFKEKLDPRSKSTLCQEEMVFAPYNAEQLQAILKERTVEGFKEGYVEDSAIALASAYAAQESGDARYALKLLLKAGEIADEQNKRVTDEDVKNARNAVEEDIVLELIQTLPDQQSIVLFSVATLTEEGGKYQRLGGGGNDPALFSGEVYQRYQTVCKQWHRNARSARWVREYLNELEMLGLITTELSGKGIRGQTRLIRLSFPAEKVLSAVQKRFAE
ncbi:MAG: orc1/cdc6 family replication initiation protein [Candidatus Diapherotrites archaeon]|nr:orc1/cdc6 family replication initiation protein [Candidatus Diapherotrites archaeon]